MNKLNAPAIESIGLRKTYRNGLFGRTRFDALKGIDFSVDQGEIFGLLGPNGAGKTTTVKVLLGIIHSSGGTATMLGEKAGTLAARRKVGYLPESLRIRGHHTATSAMRYYGQLSGLAVSEIKKKENHLLELVGLDQRKKESIKQFSKGMLQRLGLAQALLHEPQLLMLDEPTDGLDPLARSDMRNTMTRLRDEGKTIFLNSHILQEVELVCDRVAILDKGKLLYCGSVAEVGDQRDKMASRQQWHVELEVAGTAELVKQVMGNLAYESIEPTKSGDLAIHVKLDDQTAVDQLVDKIRAAQLSLVSLSRKQDSLESAFLDLLDENKDRDSQTN